MSSGTIHLLDIDIFEISKGFQRTAFLSRFSADRKMCVKIFKQEPWKGLLSLPLLNNDLGAQETRMWFDRVIPLLVLTLGPFFIHKRRITCKSIANVRYKN